MLNTIILMGVAYSIDSKQKSEKVPTTNQSSEQLTLPSYLNPGAVNPKQFQSTLDKRKLLWSKSKKVKIDAIMKIITYIVYTE